MAQKRCPSIYEDYDIIQQKGVNKFHKKGLLYVYNSLEADVYEERVKADPQKYKKMGDELYRAAHNIDLMRCYDKSKFMATMSNTTFDGLRSLRQLLGTRADEMLNYPLVQ